MISSLQLTRYDLQDRRFELDNLATHLAAEERYLGELRYYGCSGHCEKCGESHDGRGWSNVTKSMDVISQIRYSVQRLADNLRDLEHLLQDLQNT